jgi:hypothetical protein
MNSVHPAAMANRTIEQWYCFIGSLRCPNCPGTMARTTAAVESAQVPVAIPWSFNDADFPWFPAR